MKGYEYRQEKVVDTRQENRLSVELETPEAVHQSSGARVGQTRDLRSTDPRREQPVLAALWEVGQQELGVLKKHGDMHQAIAGADAVSDDLSMKEIRKRKSIDDWIFGTNAKSNAAAGIKGALKVTAWASQTLKELPSYEDMAPEDYLDMKQKEIMNAANQIEDHELKEAFIQQASQRLGQILAAHKTGHHEYLQMEGKNNFQADLKSRMALIKQWDAHGGVGFDVAVADLKTLFETIPEGMTKQAHQAAIAEAIIQTAHDGNRDLYQFAEAQGYLDSMPEDIRTKLDEDYKRAAPTNNIEYVAADEEYKRAMKDPRISTEDFIQLQLEYIAKWDTVHSYSDEALANHRLTHQRALEGTAKKQSSLLEDTLIYATPNNTAAITQLEAVSPQRLQKAASNYYQNLFRSEFLVNSPDELAAFDALESPQRQQMMMDTVMQMAVSQDPGERQQANAFMQRMARDSAERGTKVNALSNYFNAATSAPVVNGEINTEAVQAYNLLNNFYLNNHQSYLDHMTDSDTLARVITFSNLKKAGVGDGDALLAMHNMDTTKKSSAENNRELRDKLSRGTDKVTEMVDKRGWTKHLPFNGLSDPMNIATIESEVMSIAKTLMLAQPQIDAKSAIETAGVMVGARSELVANIVTVKPNSSSLASIIGFSNPDADVTGAIEQAALNHPSASILPVKKGKILWDNVKLDVNYTNGYVKISPLLNADGNEVPAYGSVIIPFRTLSGGM